VGEVLVALVSISIEASIFKSNDSSIHPIFFQLGGFGTYILGMSKKIAEDFDEAKTSINVEEPSLGRIIAFLFLVSFVGLFSIVPLRKIMIISYKLTYPSGSATAHLINSFHTPQGAIQAKQQVSILFKSFAGSFLWSLFQWFYSAGPGCGFSSFPTFGMEAYRRRFFFDFSATYVGVGMICPYIINFSLLLGSVVSWGLMWPYIESKRGLWYDAELPRSSLHGLNGYQIFISIAMIIGDGLFNFPSSSAPPTTCTSSAPGLQRPPPSHSPASTSPSARRSASTTAAARRSVERHWQCMHACWLFDHSKI
jgi:hypothetical protein